MMFIITGNCLLKLASRLRKKIRQTNHDWNKKTSLIKKSLLLFVCLFVCWVLFCFFSNSEKAFCLFVCLFVVGFCLIFFSSNLRRLASLNIGPLYSLDMR